MDFLKRILSKLGKSGLGEKVGHAGQKLLGAGAEGLARAKTKLTPEQLRRMAGLGAVGATGAVAGSGATLASLKDEDDEGSEMEEMFKKAKKKSRDWME